MSVLSAFPVNILKTVLSDEPTKARHHDDHDKLFDVIYPDSLKGKSLDDILFVYQHDHDLIPGTYLHRKSQRLYKVICLVISPDSSIIYVLYKSMYQSPKFGKESYWVRELDNFTEIVSNAHGSNKPRFEYIGP